MQMTDYFVGVYWGPRDESREACAARISAFLITLARQDAVLSRWFEQVFSLKQPLVPVPTTPEGLAPLLEVNRLDFGSRDVIPELGFSFSAWNGGEDGAAASVSASCGAYTPVVSNSAVVDFDPEIVPAADVLRGILQSAVAAFDPDEGVVSSTKSALALGVSRIWDAPALYRYRRSSGFSEN
jgi:hypothetical protein